MAGYSGTPLVQKLGIKDGSRVALIDGPSGFRLNGVKFIPGKNLDVILLFSTAFKHLEKKFPAAAKRLAQAGGLWVCWPKMASGLATNLNENHVRKIGLATGLVDNKVCAVDETWSGLRFVIRLEDRAPK